MNLLLHPSSKERYDITVTEPPQSLMIVAPIGSGKEHILRTLALDILGSHSAGRLYEIMPPEDKKFIGIDAIRELKINLRLKSAKKRVVIIPHANLLTIEAQNSLLKILEEPPVNVHFLLAVPNLEDVLETISSRTLIWRMVLPAPEQIHEYYKQYPEAARNKAIAISESRMGLIDALLTQQENHNLIHAIEVAKEILGENHFSRMVRVESLSKDLIATKELIDALRLVCNAALVGAAKKNSNSVKQWHKRLGLIIQAGDWLEGSVQSKLVLSYLFMRI